jgi:hypothetical protein
MSPSIDTAPHFDSDMLQDLQTAITSYQTSSRRSRPYDLSQPIHHSAVFYPVEVGRCSAGLGLFASDAIPTSAVVTLLDGERFEKNAGRELKTKQNMLSEIGLDFSSAQFFSNRSVPW